MVDEDIQDGSAARISRTRGEIEQLRNSCEFFATLAGYLRELTRSRQFLPPIPRRWMASTSSCWLGPAGRDINGQRGWRLARGASVIRSTWSPNQRSPPCSATLSFRIVDRISVTEVALTTGRRRPTSRKKRSVRSNNPSTSCACWRGKRSITPRRLAGGFLARSERKVFFTMLGAAAWIRPRLRTDPPSKFRDFPAPRGHVRSICRR